MSMDRWDPIREMLTLRDSVDRLFQQGVGRSGGVLAALRSDIFPVDLRETDAEYVLKASIPGVNPDDVQVTLQGTTLTIAGEAKAEEERSSDQWLLRESRSGSFRRAVDLPSPVNIDAARAQCENGVLTLTLPKAQATQPRRIPIGGTAGAKAASRAAAGAQHGGGDHTAGGDLVTESSQQSFPASDPPSWTPEKS